MRLTLNQSFWKKAQPNRTEQGGKREDSRDEVAAGRHDKRRLGNSGFLRRGSIEKRAVPGAHYKVQHWDRNRSHGMHKCDCRSNGRDWRRRMHDHADRAMIGIRRGGMDVRYLDEGHQRKQQNADQRNCAHHPWVALAAVDPMLFDGVLHPIHANTTRIHRFKHGNEDLAVRKWPDSIWPNERRPRASRIV